MGEHERGSGRHRETKYRMIAAERFFRFYATSFYTVASCCITKVLSGNGLNSIINREYILICICNILTGFQNIRLKCYKIIFVKCSEIIL